MEPRKAKLALLAFALSVAALPARAQQPKYPYTHGFFSSINQNIVYADAYAGSTTAAMVQNAVNANLPPVTIVIPGGMPGTAGDFTGISLSSSGYKIEDERGSEIVWGFKSTTGTSVVAILTMTQTGITVPACTGCGTGGGGTPGGGLDAVQYQDPLGTFAGDSTNFSYDPTTHQLSVAGGLAVGATSLVDGTLSTSAGALTLQSGGSRATLRQAADTFGASRLMAVDYAGAEGGAVQNESSLVTDFAFLNSNVNDQTLVRSTWNSADFVDPSNSFEFQLREYLPSQKDLFAVGDQAAQSLVPLTAPISDKGGQVYNVKAYGAKGDGVIITDASITASSTNLTAASSEFTSGMVGKTISVNGAGASGGYLVSTVATYNSPTSISLADAASTTATATLATWGTDDEPAIQAAITAMGSAGGILYFPNGIYEINTLQSVDSTHYAAVDLPAQTAAVQGADWIVQGESATMWTGEVNDPLQTNGVIINVTPAAVASAGASTNTIYGLYQAASAVYPFVRQEAYNITVRFPDNQRGNTIAFDAENSGDLIWSGDLADFASKYTDLSVASTSSVDGFLTMPSSKGNVVQISDSYAVGQNYGFFSSADHLFMNSDTSIYCSYAGQVGGIHATSIRNFMDQENKRGLALYGSAGNLIDIMGYDIEQATSGTWSRVQNLQTGVVNNGTVSYSLVDQGSGLQACPASIFVGAGGSNWIQQCGGKLSTHYMATRTSSNTDFAGQLTLASGTASYTFSGTYASAPICTATDTTGANPVQVGVTTTALTLTGTGADVVNYVCIGRN